MVRRAGGGEQGDLLSFLPDLRNPPLGNTTPPCSLAKPLPSFHIPPSLSQGLHFLQNPFPSCNLFWQKPRQYSKKGYFNSPSLSPPSRSPSRPEQPWELRNRSVTRMLPSAGTPSTGAVPVTVLPGNPPCLPPLARVPFLPCLASQRSSPGSRVSWRSRSSSHC